LGILVVCVLINELPLVLLIQGDDVLSSCLHSHQHVAGLPPICLDVDAGVEEGGAELAHHDLSKVDVEVLPGHVERAVIGVAVVVEAIPEIFCPKS
jgi:hypothetical protein